MPDYSKSKIYKIVDNTNGNVYIGSTTQSLSQRLAGHNSSYKGILKGNQKFITSFEIIKNGNYDIVLLEEFSCDNKEQLHAKERVYIESNECINHTIPTRTSKEYKQHYCERIRSQDKEYQVLHKEHYKEVNKEYMDKHREHLTKLRKVKTICECGCEVCLWGIERHKRTKKHQELLKIIK